MNKKLPVIKALLFGIKFSAREYPIIFAISILLFILQGAIRGITAFMTQLFFDSVGDVLTGAGTLNRALLMIGTLVLTIAGKELLNGFPSLVSGLMLEKSASRMNQLLHLKMARLDPIYLEDTELHNDTAKAMRGAWTVVYITNVTMLLFSFYPAYFATMGLYLHHLKPQFLLALIMVFLPVLLGQFIRTVIIAKLEDKTAPIRREYDYYQKAIVDREYFKETRLLGGYSFFLDRFLQKLKILNRFELKANFKTCMLEFVIGLLSAASYAGILYMLVSALLAGEVTVGAFAAVIGSVGMLFNMMSDMINSQIGAVASNLGMAHNFIRFMDLPERPDDNGEPDYNQGIVVDNISFTYPHAERMSIDNVSLTIKAREMVAIVGENGAGKTTLVRLLMGLYTPNEGKVFLHGMDTAKVGAEALFMGTSGVFQRYQRYQMTLDENIRISQFGNKGDINIAAKQAGIDIDSTSFPKGENTMLSREFDGIDLSGGEWQRVAIARGFFRSHNLVVLDEPTAAIDPIEESHIYHRFMDISKGKTAIVITHRLGSAKLADRIIVMDKGKIVAMGSHSELLAQNGLYSKMFHTQALWYDTQKTAVENKSRNNDNLNHPNIC